MLTCCWRARQLKVNAEFDAMPSSLPFAFNELVNVVSEAIKMSDTWNTTRRTMPGPPVSVVQQMSSFYATSLGRRMRRGKILLWG